MKESLSRGAIFSLDAIVASVAVILIVYIGFTAFSTFAHRTLLLAENEEMDSKLLLLSDYLVKHGLCESDGARVYQHQISMKKIEELDTEKLASELGVKNVGVSLSFGEQTVASKGEGKNCVRRIAWVRDYERVGYLGACID